MKWSYITKRIENVHGNWRTENQVIAKQIPNKLRIKNMRYSMLLQIASATIHSKNFQTKLHIFYNTRFGHHGWLNRSANRTGALGCLNKNHLRYSKLTMQLDIIIIIRCLRWMFGVLWSVNYVLCFSFFKCLVAKASDDVIAYHKAYRKCP